LQAKIEIYDQNEQLGMLLNNLSINVIVI